jgi:hypothetical protein
MLLNNVLTLLINQSITATRSPLHEQVVGACDCHTLSRYNPMDAGVQPEVSSRHPRLWDARHVLVTTVKAAMSVSCCWGFKRRNLNRCNKV